jgi:hypothetical protein
MDLWLRGMQKISLAAVDKVVTIVRVACDV